MVGLSPQDALALKIGRSILDLHIARQHIATLEQKVAELEARLVEHQIDRQEQPA